MQQELSGKTAIITGSSRGIGRAIALRLAAMGAGVTINYHQDSQAADEVGELIRKDKGRALVVQADVRTVRGIQALFDQTTQFFGAVDILVNNAGILITKPLEQITEEEYQHIFDCNVKSVVFACREAAQRLTSGGRIINISTTVTRLLLPGYGLYAATKGAVDQITRVLAKELGPREITVNAISPGPTDTELFRAGKTPQQIKMMAEMAALSRLGTPEDIAGAVALLVRADAGWISGENICANGGLAA